MSADRWGTCPKCKAAADKAQDDARLSAGKAYGKVSSEKYLELLKAAEERPELEPTFREDYEVGTDEDGFFSVSYSGHCSCGFSHKFTHEEQLKR